MRAIAARLSRDPVVYRNAVAALILAAVQIGVLTSDQADAVDGYIKVLAPVVTLVLPLVAALLARRRTAPVAADTPEVRYLVRGADGVYSPATPADLRHAGTRGNLTT